MFYNKMERVDKHARIQGEGSVRYDWSAHVEWGGLKICANKFENYTHTFVCMCVLLRYQIVCKIFIHIKISNFGVHTITLKLLDRFNSNFNRLPFIFKIRLCLFL